MVAIPDPTEKNIVQTQTLVKETLDIGAGIIGKKGDKYPDKYVTWTMLEEVFKGLGININDGSMRTGATATDANATKNQFWVDTTDDDNIVKRV